MADQENRKPNYVPFDPAKHVKRPLIVHGVCYPPYELFHDCQQEGKRQIKDRIKIAMVIDQDGVW